MMRLFHVTIIMGTRDEHASAKGETRTFTRRGRRAADAKAKHLRERNPGSPIEVRAVPATDRSPVIL